MTTTSTPSLLQVQQAHDLIAKAAEAQAAVKQWSEYLADIKEQLMELHSAGVVPV